MRNKTRFWTGIGLIVPEVLAMIIVVLTLVDWSFITLRVLGIAAIVLYNLLAGILIWNGSGKEDECEIEIESEIKKKGKGKH